MYSSPGRGREAPGGRPWSAQGFLGKSHLAEGAAGVQAGGAQAARGRRREGLQ